METRKIIIIGASVVVVGLVVLLFLETRSSSTSTLSADKKAKALAEYERRARLEQGPSVQPDTEVSRPRARTSRKSADESPVETAPPRVASPPKLPPTMKSSKVALRAPSVTLGTTRDNSEAKEKKEAVRSAYDSGNYDEAQRLSLEAIKSSPGDIKLLRYVVSSSCAVGEVDTARTYAAKLPKRDRDQMAKRCQHSWGAEL